MLLLLCLDANRSQSYKAISAKNWCSKTKFYHALHQFWCNLGQNGHIGLTPGFFNPTKNIFSSENFSVKSQKILKPQIFSVKQKNFLCRFFGAASWGRFLKNFTEIFDRNTTWKICRNFLKTENLARKQKKILLIELKPVSIVFQILYIL